MFAPSQRKCGRFNAHASTRNFPKSSRYVDAFQIKLKESNLTLMDNFGFIIQNVDFHTEIS